MRNLILLVVLTSCAVAAQEPTQRPDSLLLPVPVVQDTLFVSWQQENIDTLGNVIPWSEIQFDVAVKKAPYAETWRPVVMAIPSDTSQIITRTIQLEPGEYRLTVWACRVNNAGVFCSPGAPYAEFIFAPENPPAGDRETRRYNITIKIMAR